jgi:hypothetical protein
LRKFLTEVILTPAGKVDEQSRLFQSYKGTPEVREIEMPDKLRAVEQLAKLCGWNDRHAAWTVAAADALRKRSPQPTSCEVTR